MATAPAYTLRVREQDLSGKVAIVTGASRGIGRAVALNLASRGCAILGTCSNTQTLHLVDSLVHSVQKLYDGAAVEHPKILGAAIDIFLPDCGTKITSVIQQDFGGHVDILILNAAHTGPTPIGVGDVEAIQKFFVANIQSPVLIVDALVKQQMFRKDSRIILASSVGSHRPAVETSLYSATKAAGEALIRTWSEAFGGKHPQFEFMAPSTANSVLVGITKTASMEWAKKEFPETAGRYAKELNTWKSIPREGECEDVADVVGLLCSHDARWITGSLVSCDGGAIKIC